MVFAREVQEFIKQHGYNLTDKEVRNRVENLNDEQYNDLIYEIDAVKNNSTNNFDTIEKILNL